MRTRIWMIPECMLLPMSTRGEVPLLKDHGILDTEGLSRLVSDEASVENCQGLLNVSPDLDKNLIASNRHSFRMQPRFP